MNVGAVTTLPSIKRLVKISVNESGLVRAGRSVCPCQLCSDLFHSALGSSLIWRRVVVYVQLSIIKAGKVKGVNGEESTGVDSASDSK